MRSGQVQKASGVPKQYLPELIKCAKDPVYFLNTYCKILTLEHGIVPFELYDFQIKCIKDYQKHRFNINCKSRQLGLSTVTAGYALWKALFQRNQTILCIATKNSAAVGFIKKVKEFWKNLPKWLQFVEYAETTQEVRLGNGSIVEAVPTSEDAGRGKSINLLIVDEAAHIKNFGTVWTSIYPALSTGGNAIIISTPAGVGNQYYDIWVGAESKTNNFHATKLPWHVHPEHNDEWFANETKGLSKRLIAQEFLCEFIGSGDTFLQTDQMVWLSGKTKQPIKYDPIEKELWLWEDPVPGARYLIAADVSRGDSKDYSAFHIMNVDTGYVIGEYQGKVTPDLFAGILFRVGNQYNRALIIVESNSYGNHTLIELKKANYSNIYYHGTPKALIGNYVPKHTDKMGFFTGTENRLAALTSLEECLRLEKMIPCSVRVYNEFQTFIWSSDKKPQAIKGKTDDLVMSLAIAAWCFKQYYDTGSIKKDKSNNAPEFYIGFSNKPMTPERNHLNSMLPSIGKNHLKTPIQTDLDPNDIRWLIS